MKDGVIIILASRFDPVADALVERWQSCHALRMTCADLSRAGWSIDNGGDGDACIAGRRIACGDIRGVINRLPYVTPTELPHIAPHDRDYVAMEMSMFLLAWLTGLRCPVLNRPTPNCLIGPNWRELQWMQAAASVGMDVRPIVRRAPSAPATEERYTGVRRVVTVVGDECPLEQAPLLSSRAVALARKANVELLDVTFETLGTESRFIAAGLCPDISHPLLADALLARLGIQSTLNVEAGSAP
ncbi:MAG TPA: hypothetical protein VF669_17550 [Tepidisphaeraceae bacterium]